MDTIDEFTTTWQTEFQRGLNNVEFLSSGPLWKLCHVIVNHNHNHVKNNVDSCNIDIDVDVDLDDDIDVEKEEDNRIEDLDDKNMDQKDMENKVDKSGLIFIMNHGIDDQKSINIIMKDLLFYINYYLYNNKHYNNNNDHSVSVDNATTTTTTTSIISTANINNKIQKFDFPLSIEKAISNSSKNNISTTYKLILWIILQVYNSLSFPTLLPNRIKKEIQQIIINNNNHKHKSSSNDEYIIPNNRYTYCKFFNLTKMNINSLKLKLNEQRDIEYYNKLKNINHIYNGTDNNDDVNDEDDNICNSSSGSSDKYNFNRFFIKILQNNGYDNNNNNNNNNNNSSRRKLSITNILSAAMLCVSTAFLQDMNHCHDCHLIDDRDDDNMLEELKLRFLLSVDLRPYGTSSTTTVSPTSFTTSATTTSAIDRKDDNNDFTGGTVACAAGAIDFIVPMTKRMSKLILPWASSSSSILSSEFKDEFWQLVAQTRDSSSMIIDEFDLVPESVRLFGLGMIPDDMFLFP